jgi:hypothetical protein
MDRLKMFWSHQERYVSVPAHDVHERAQVADLRPPLLVEAVEQDVLGGTGRGLQLRIVAVRPHVRP